MYINTSTHKHNRLIFACGMTGKTRGYFNGLVYVVFAFEKIFNKIPHMLNVVIKEVPPQLKNGSVTPVIGKSPIATEIFTIDCVHINKRIAEDKTCKNLFFIFLAK